MTKARVTPIEEMKMFNVQNCSSLGILINSIHLTILKLCSDNEERTDKLFQPQSDMNSDIKFKYSF